MKKWKGYQIRVERDGSVTFRTPAGRAIGWGPAAALDSNMDTFCRKGAVVDVSRAPAALNATPVFES